MKNIVPLYPEHTNNTVRDHVDYNIGIIDPIVLSNVVALFVPFYSLWYRDQTFLLLAVINNIFSVIYHHSSEQNKWAGIFDRILTITSMFYFYAFHFRWQYVEILLSILVISTYYLASGRHSHSHRSAKYVSYHSVFHLSVSALVSYSTLS